MYDEGKVGDCVYATDEMCIPRGDEWVGGNQESASGEVTRQGIMVHVK